MPDDAAAVDQWVQDKVLPQFHDVVAYLRRLVADAAPEAREVLTYGILGWRKRKILAVVSPTKKDITLSFSKGASFEDPYGLLGGTGHVSKFVKLKRVEDANEEALRYYIAQALEHDPA